MSMNEGIHRIIIPCECAGTCELAMITYIESEDDDWRHEGWYLTWFVTLRQGAPLRERIRQAWKMLWKKDHWIHDIVISRKSAAELCDWLTKTLGEGEDG